MIYEFYGKKHKVLQYKGHGAIIGIEISYEGDIMNYNIGVFSMGKSSPYPIQRSNYNRFFSSQPMDSFSPLIWEFSPVLRIFHWCSADRYGSRLHRKLQPIEEEYVRDIASQKLLGEALFTA